MIIMAFDPGQTTGIVTLGQTPNGKHVLLYMEDCNEEETLFLLMNRFPDVILVERSPLLTPNKQQTLWVNKLISTAQMFLTNTSIVQHSPGEWKPFAQAQNWKHPQATSQHQQDAYNMLRWSLLQRQGKDIGVLLKEENNGTKSRNPRH